MKNENEILKEAAERAEMHQIVGHTVKELSRIGLYKTAAEVTMGYIMGRPVLTNPQTYQDLQRPIIGE